MGCDCGAEPDEIAAGIHYPGCTSSDGPADDPSDHYGSRSSVTKRLAFESPYGCRWCGVERRHHGRRREAIIGMHSWVEPTQEAIKNRMWRRLDARLNVVPPQYHATTGWSPDHTGESADPYCADCKTDGCPKWSRIQVRLDQQRWGIPRRIRRRRRRTSGAWGGNEPF